MLSERQLEEILQIFRHRAQAVTEEYLIRMGQHLRDIGTLSASDINRLIELKRMNYNMEQIKRQIAAAVNAPLSEVEKVFQQVAESDLRFAAKVFAADHTPRIKDNPTLERILKAQAKITKQALANLSQTTILSEGYKNAVDVAVQTVQAGITDYNAAIRRAMKAAAQEGLRVQYPNSGYTRRLDSAVRMNVLDGIRAINQDVMRQVGKEFGADGIELTAHMLCAEDHLPYQGTQMSIKDFEHLQNTILDRPFGMWNCRHTWHYIILGVSKPAYTPEELAQYKLYSRERIEIDGVVKSRYEWTQEQRRVETAIRYQKDIAVAAKASGDMVARRECASMIRELQKYYSKISNVAGLLEKPERMRVAGFSAVKPADQLKTSLKHGIIDTGNGKTYMRIYTADGEEKFRYLKTDAIEKLNSTEEICNFFIYTDVYGDKYSPLSDEFVREKDYDYRLPPIDYYLSGFKLDIQKEIAEGILWAKTTFALDRLPMYIKKGRPKNDALGSYDSGLSMITINNTIKLEQSFFTAVHEMAHFATRSYRIDTDDLFKQAMKNIGVKRNTREANALQHHTVGVLNRSDDWKDPDELVAYSWERNATGKENKLSVEICRLWLERMGIN
ncbi:MAG: hypothetical protein IJ466_11575 [Clostridia bacterium]|nr:hypothetical protein [Clostridia bacterium]